MPKVRLQGQNKAETPETKAEVVDISSFRQGLLIIDAALSPSCTWDFAGIESGSQVRGPGVAHLSPVLVDFAKRSWNTSFLSYGLVRTGRQGSVGLVRLD